MSRSINIIGQIPIGGCIPWMAPSVGGPQPELPAGWEYADGGEVSTVGSSILGLTKPSLMRTVENPGATQNFIMGADTTSTYGGATAFDFGGSATHTHTGGTDTVGAHAHGGSVAAGGATTTSTESSNQGALDLSLITGGSDTVALSHSHTVGNHLHGINSDGDHDHVVTVDAGGSLPPYISMAWIIRVL